MVEFSVVNLSVVLLHSNSLSSKFSLSKYSRQGAGGAACDAGGGYLLQLCNSNSTSVTIWSKWLTTPRTSSWLVPREVCKSDKNTNY